MNTNSIARALFADATREYNTALEVALHGVDALKRQATTQQNLCILTAVGDLLVARVVQRWNVVLDELNVLIVASIGANGGNSDWNQDAENVLMTTRKNEAAKVETAKEALYLAVWFGWNMNSAKSFKF
jgi:hypothetical protein